MSASNEYMRKWKAAHPEQVKAQRRRDSQRRAEIPELRARINNLARVRGQDPIVKEKRRQAKLRWIAANPERWYRQCRERLARKPWVRLLVKARVRCKETGLTYELTNEWAIARWTGTCELTNLPFSAVASKAGPYSASLDRIDSTKGYTPDNCRFILWGLNRFKGDGTDEEMRAIARALVGQ